MFFFFFYTGKGAPEDRAKVHVNTGAISSDLIPSANAAVEMYHSSGGHLQLENSFAADPLAQLPQKVLKRDREFAKYFPSLHEIFHKVSNGDYEPFKNALLYYIRLTYFLLEQN